MLDCFPASRFSSLDREEIDFKIVVSSPLRPRNFIFISSSSQAALKMHYGHSINPDAEAAAAEAIAIMRKKIQKPGFIVLFHLAMNNRIFGKTLTG